MSIPVKDKAPHHSGFLSPLEDVVLATSLKREALSVAGDDCHAIGELKFNLQETLSAGETLSVRAFRQDAARREQVDQILRPAAHSDGGRTLDGFDSDCFHGNILLGNSKGAFQDMSRYGGFPLECFFARLAATSRAARPTRSRED